MVLKILTQSIAAAIILFSCSQKNSTKTITVTNTLDLDRTETVELSKDFLMVENLSTTGIRDLKTKKLLVTQTVDNDGDGNFDAILFQPEIAANAEVQFEIVTVEEHEKPKAEALCYARFVPERTDDYAWENDKVAFRTFGPKAQKLVEEKLPEGTLTSGIDLWLKKVDHSIIDKWYKKYTEKTGSYHEDTGEGYDPYHVGKSRGTGGIGVWTGDTLLTSKNFMAYRTIAVGPIRTVFELDYAPWSTFGIKETKRISLDLGSHFSKFEIHLSPKQPVPNYAIGITLHDGKGEVSINKDRGYYAHWEQIDGAFLGEGIIISPNHVKEAFDYRTPTPDQSQLLVLTDPNQKILSYYAGFAWTGSGAITTKEDWINLLETQAKKINNPLKVVLN